MVSIRADAYHHAIITTKSNLINDNFNENMIQKGGGFNSPTLVKTCEDTKQIRQCRSPQDWALLALQNIRTGKSQYLVICHCLHGQLGKLNS